MLFLLKKESIKEFVFIFAALDAAVADLYMCVVTVGSLSACHERVGKLNRFYKAR